MPNELPVLEIRNTPSAIDVVFKDLTMDEQVPAHLARDGITLDQILFIDPRASKLAEKVLQAGGYVATPSQGRDKVQPLVTQYKGRVFIAEKPLAEGTANILKRQLKACREILYVLIHNAALYERGKMAGQEPYIKRIARITEDEINMSLYIRLVTGRSGAQILARPYAEHEPNPADRLDQGMLGSFGFLSVRDAEGDLSPHFAEDGAVLVYQDGTITPNLPPGIKANLMSGVIVHVNSLLDNLNRKYAGFTADGTDPFYIPNAKLTRATLNLPKALRNANKRAAVEDLVITTVRDYATREGCQVKDCRTYTPLTK